MADTAIPGLTLIDALDDLDEFPVNDVSAVDDRKVTGAQIATYIGNKSSFLIFKVTANNLTAGSPSDIATITIPANITRWKLVGSTATNSGNEIITETQAGTPAAGTMALFTRAGGTGTQLLATTAPSNGANTGVGWSPLLNGLQTVNTLFIRQMVDSLNSANLSFYVMIVPYL